MITGQIRGKKVIINNKPADVSELNIEASTDIYYEIVRVADGQFMFLHDHLERLKLSLSHSGLKYPGNEFLRVSLKKLLSVSEEQTGNIKISVYRNGGEQVNVVIHFVSHLYPTTQMYSEGVKLYSFNHTRPQPGIKKWDGSFRKRVNDFIAENQIYEAILINEMGEITEGSRSNVFFISNKVEIFTPSGDSVLKGITRKYVIEIARKLNIPLRESTIKARQSSTFVSCFITGTSPKVLPVQSLNEITFQINHPILQKIMEAFGSIILDHIEEL